MVAIFTTPPNERSFSGLVDAVALETGRLPNLLSIIQYANETIRECQTLGLFARDRVEETIVTDAQPFSWSRPMFFRSVGAAKYMTQCAWPRLKIPGRQLENEQWYFYAASGYYVFVGVMTGETIAMANYYWQKPLLYSGRLGTDTSKYAGGPYSDRKAYYDLELSKWQYLDADDDEYVDTTGDTVEDELRQANAANWLVLEWYDCILEGTKAKLFGRFDDQTRANTSYATYKYQQKLLQATAGFEAEAGNV